MTGKNMRAFGVRMMAMILLSAPPALAGETVALPRDPSPPTSNATCNALYADYRVLIDGLRGEAETCNSSRAIYIQERYGHEAGEGECARRTIGPCRSLVEQCTDVRTAALAALDRCHRALGPE
jgi:hypothetical protein